MLTRRKWILGASTGAVVIAMAALALAAGGGRGRLKPDKGPFGWPNLQTVKEKLDLSHDQAEGLLRLFNKYEHEEKQATQGGKTGDKNDKAPDVSALRSDALTEIKKLLGDATFGRFEEVIGGGKKKK